MLKLLLMILGLGVTQLVALPPAWGVLGSSPGEVLVNGEPLAGPLHISRTPAYSVQEIVSQEVVVREYVSSAGIVFAVSWTGRRSPDLPALLGPYFDQYAAAAADRERGRSPLRGLIHVETADLIVETGGHMGAVWGKAYLPSRLPAEITNEAIQ